MEKLSPTSRIQSPLPPAESAAEPVQEILSWSVHELRRQPQRIPALTTILVGVMALSLCIFHSLWLALMPVLAVLLSLSEFIFPVRYTLTTQSASVRYGLTALEIPWADVRHAYLTESGIKLSPLRAKNSRFEGLRGVYLRFDAHNEDVVIAAVKRLRLENSLENAVDGQ